MLRADKLIRLLCETPLVMYPLIRQLFTLLTLHQRRQYYVLQMLVVVMAIVEMLAIASVAPFMALVGNPELLQGDNVLAHLYQRLGFTHPHDMLLWSGALLLAALTAAALFSLYTTWRLSMFAATVGVETADRLYTHYLNQPWVFHLTGSSAQWVSRITNEAQRVTNDIIQPLMMLNAKLVVASLITLGLLLYDPLIAMAGFSLFATAYVTLYRLLHRRLRRNGETVSRVATERHRLMNVGFGAIKEMSLLGRTSHFIQRFNNQGRYAAHALGNSNTLIQAPRYLVELLAFGSMVALVLMLLIHQQAELGAILPALALYGVAGLKLLPAFQQIYHSTAQIKANIPAFETIRADLLAARAATPAPESPCRPLALNQHIQLDNVTFTYPEAAAPSLSNISLSIPARGVVGIIGASGAGKTTLVDLLLGLLTPQQGSLCIDNQPLTGHNLRCWQRQLGYVPQHIFLAEGTIAENVALGINAEQIDPQCLERALTTAHLHHWVATLPQGVNTSVGEHGVQLSGGQRQRIGIARALYHDPAVLLFDEATSALDGATEKAIMDAIHTLAGQKTLVLIAHRLNTVRRCDTLYLIDHGQLQAQGSYDELLRYNPIFQRMVSHA